MARTRSTLRARRGTIIPARDIKVAHERVLKASPVSILDSQKTEQCEAGRDQSDIEDAPVWIQGAQTATRVGHENRFSSP